MFNSGPPAATKSFLDIQFKGELAKKLVQAIAKMQRFEPLLHEIGTQAVQSVRKNFLESRTPEGQRWPGLKKPRGPKGNALNMPLLDSLELFESIDYIIADQDFLRLGFPSETGYGWWHEEGTRWLPQRRFLGVRDADKAGFRAALQDHIVEAFA